MFNSKARFAKSSFFSRERGRFLFSVLVCTGTIALSTTVASAGYLFVGDYTNNSVKRFDAASGSFLDQQALSGDFGPGNPMGMAVGPDGNLYVADNTNNSVEKFDGTTGAFLSHFIPTSASTLSQPSGLVFDPDGNLYVANYGTGGFGFINRFNGTTGALIDQFVAPGSGPPLGGLAYPMGMTFGPNGNLFVADDNNGTIDEFDRTTGAFTAFVVAGSPPSPLAGPESVAFGPDGNLYVTDVTTSTIHRYNGATGAYLDEFVPTNGGLVQPIDLKFGPGNALYVTDGMGRVTRFDNTTGAAMSDLVLSDGHTLVNPQFMAFSVPEPLCIAMVFTGGVCFGFWGLLRDRRNENACRRYLARKSRTPFFTPTVID
jgi:DNA-binding beta-propeller fold protein YncE